MCHRKRQKLRAKAELLERNRRRLPKNGSEGSEAFAIHTLTQQLAAATDGFGFFTSALFRRLFESAAKLHFAENTFTLHLLLERAQCLIDIIVADQNVDDGSYSR